MKTAGIIAEYNPFHNGHAYQIEEVRRQTGADYVIVIMSGDFVQRGEPAIVDKYLRTRMALEGGADIVLELPVLFACAGAEYFARGGVSILNSLGCVDTLCFGTEQKDLSDFEPAADLLTEEPPAYRQCLASYLREGMGYPSARSAALSDCLDTDISFLRKPNNILALEYLCALKRLGSSITPVSIQRVGSGYHDHSLTGQFASATAIRNSLFERNTGFQKSLASDTLHGYMPESAIVLLKKHFDAYGPLCIQNFSSILQYRLLTIQSPEELSSYFDIDSFLANRIFQNRFAFSSFSDFTELITSKNKTRGHIQRALFHILLNLSEPEGTAMFFPQYTRILGMKRESSGILKCMKNSSSIPILTKMADAFKVIDASTLSEGQKKAACCQLQQTTLSSHVYESVLSQKYNTIFRHENTRQIVIL